jgi:hypothetical protein
LTSTKFQERIDPWRRNRGWHFVSRTDSNLRQF